MNARSRFNIPANFVVDRVDLKASEIAYGKRKGWLNDSDIVAIYLHKMQAGQLLSKVEESWALALSEDVRVGNVPELEFEAQGNSREVDKVWIYLSLAWLRHRVLNEQKLFDIIDDLYSDFDYPEEMEGFVKYMPCPPGGREGVSGMMERLELFLKRSEDLYRQR